MGFFVRRGGDTFVITCTYCRYRFFFLLLEQYRKLNYFLIQFFVALYFFLSERQFSEGFYVMEGRIFGLLQEAANSLFQGHNQLKTLYI